METMTLDTSGSIATGDQKPSSAAPQDSPWTQERIEQLTALWEAGRTCSEIAAEIGGVSRNAVIGKVNRLGLPKRKTVLAYRTAKPIGTTQYSRRQSAVRDAKPSAPLPKPKPSPVESKNITFFKLKGHHCRYITSAVDERPVLYCGHDVSKPGTSWCPFHCSIVYAKPSEAA